MTVYMPMSLAGLMSMALVARCELSRDLMVWGVKAERMAGPKFWDGYDGPVPSPLRWAFWKAVAEIKSIDVPHIDSQQLTYEENLLAIAVEVRLRDDALTKLYRLHRGAALIYAELKKDLQDL